MNNRDYKILAQDNFYHIYNRGVGKMEIFKDDQDRRTFLQRMEDNLFPEMVPISRRRSAGGYLRKSLPSGAFTLLAYCLMPNHFHFLIRQNSNLPISTFMLKVCGSYGKYFNLKYERVGSLFQDQYKAVHVEDDTQLLWLLAYIHNNPKVAGLVPNLEDYPWSSHLLYQNQNMENRALVNVFFILEMLDRQREIYPKFVTDSYEKIKERKGLGALLLD